MASLQMGPQRVDHKREDRPLFPDCGLTRSDLIDYYRRVAEFMLPHLLDRPLTLYRFPNGLGEPGFFQADPSEQFPDWVETVELSRRDGRAQYVLADRPASLACFASLASVELHTWLSRRDAPYYPDQIVFDLDPPAGEFELARRCARDLRKLLDELGLPAFAKTSGGRGLHVHVSITRDLDYDAVRAFARAAAELLCAQEPDRYAPGARRDADDPRLYIDVSRNAYGQTTIAPYSVRALPGAPVATPIDWHEVSRSDLEPDRYTLENMMRRLGHKPDPWRDMGREPGSLRVAMRLLSDRWSGR